AALPVAALNSEASMLNCGSLTGPAMGSIYAHLQAQGDLVAYSLIAVFAHHARPFAAYALDAKEVVASRRVVPFGSGGCRRDANDRHFGRGAGDGIDGRQMRVSVQDQFGAILA